MGHSGGGVGEAEAAKHAQVIIGRMDSVKEIVWCGVGNGDGLAGKWPCGEPQPKTGE